MNKLLTLAAASLALFGAQSVSAQTYTPSGSWVMQGPVTVQKGAGPVLNCTLRITGTVANTAGDAHGSANHGHVLSVTNVQLQAGDLGCLTVSFTGLPYTTSWTAPVLTLNNVYVNTSITPGNCKGSIGGTWNDTTKKLTVDASLPQDTSGGACTVKGTLNLVSPTGGSIT